MGLSDTLKKWLYNIRYSAVSIFSIPTYIAIALIFSLTLFLINIYTINYRLLLAGITLQKLWSLFLGGFSGVSITALVLLLANVLLGGILFSFMIFLLRRQVSLTAASPGSLGIITGLIAPACPSCALGFLSVLGFGGFLSILPFKGLEIGFLGIIILFASLVYLSGKVMAETCEIPSENNAVIA